MIGLYEDIYESIEYDNINNYDLDNKLPIELFLNNDNNILNIIFRKYDNKLSGDIILKYMKINNNINNNSLKEFIDNIFEYSNKGYRMNVMEIMDDVIIYSMIYRPDTSYVFFITS